MARPREQEVVIKTDSGEQTMVAADTEGSLPSKRPRRSVVRPSFVVTEEDKDGVVPMKRGRPKGRKKAKVARTQKKPTDVECDEVGDRAVLVKKEDFLEDGVSKENEEVSVGKASGKGRKKNATKTLKSPRDVEVDEGGTRAVLKKENEILDSEKGESLMCHQCQRNDKGRVVRCGNCPSKRYCIPCLTKWYMFSP